MAIDRIREPVAEDFQAVNTLIVNTVQARAGLIEDLSYHLINSGGKRLRPLLVLLASKACGYTGKEHITLATMIECIHTATLLHDDVVDDSTLRRGQQTANNIWGSKASILVGDYLFTQSIQFMVDVGQPDILQLMADTSLQISCGEVKQLSNKHNSTLSFDDYFEVIKAKTALLFAASASIGAHLSNSTPLVKENLYAYGLHLGNAFQLWDDALDYCSEATVLGKNIGDDLADGKATLPLIHALQQAKPEQQERIRQSLEQGSLEHLPDILQAIEDTKAIDFTKQTAAIEIDRALSCLEAIPSSIYKESMASLANFAIERDY